MLAAWSRSHIAQRAGLGAARRSARMQKLPMQTNPSKDPLHGMTLEAIVTALVEHFGWAELGQRIEIKCFRIDPSVSSSLKFLRKTPWARAKVESLYLFMRREQARAAR